MKCPDCGSEKAKTITGNGRVADLFNDPVKQEKFLSGLAEEFEALRAKWKVEEREFQEILKKDNLRNRKISVEFNIEASDNYCGKCSYLGNLWPDHCDIDFDVEMDNNSREILRPQECRDAEVK